MAWRLRFRFGLNLHFIAATQIHAAVGIFPAVEFDVQLEVQDFDIADKLGAIAGADQIPVLNGPVGRTRPVHLPAGQILPIE